MIVVIVVIDDVMVRVVMADHRPTHAAHDRADRAGHDRAADRAGDGALGGVADRSGVFRDPEGGAADDQGASRSQ